MVQHRVGLGQFIALPLARDHMQELQPAQCLEIFQGGNQGIQIVAVDGPHIIETQLLEQRGGRHQPLGMALEAAGQFQHGRHVLQHRFADILRRRIEPARQQAGQIAVQRADRRGNRHIVVVQHHQHIDAGSHPGIVQGFERHPRRHRAVADDRDMLPVGTGVARSHGHAEHGRYGSGRMRRAEIVVAGFAAPGKARNAPLLAQPGHLLAPARQYLVRIGLMAHVPDQPVVGRIEHFVQGDGELYCSQVGRQMAARLRDGLQNELAQLRGKLFELRTIQHAQVGRTIDVFERDSRHTDS